MAVSRKYILLRSQQCQITVIRKEIGMVLVVFSFLFSEKYLHLIYSVYTESLGISCLFCSSQELGFLNTERDEGAVQAYQNKREFLCNFS